MTAAELRGTEESQAAIPTPPAIALVTLGAEGDRLQGRPVDPHSFADLPGYSAIDFGHHYTQALSPDGRTLASITWPNGMDNARGVLQLVDLTTWVHEVTEVTFDQYVGTLLFSPDGKQLVWAEPTRTDPAHGLPRAYQLVRYKLDGRVREEVLQFPPAFAPGEMRLLSMGSRLAIYGFPTTPDNLVEDVPHILLVDLDAGRLAADVRLEGVTAGQSRVDPAGANEASYRMDQPGLAWDLEHSLLYIVHADSDRVTVADLAAGQVRRQSDIHPKQSLLDHLWAWQAAPVQAKGVPGTGKRAVLDLDGDRLYVVGLRSEPVQQEGRQEWALRQVPLGLQVIATGDLTELGRLDLPVNDLALSPDGKWLLLTGAYDGTGADGQSERVASGLYRVDARTLQVANRLLPEREVSLHGFSADGRSGYVSTAASQWLGDHWGNWTVALHRVALDTGQIVAERDFPGNFLDLLR